MICTFATHPITIAKALARKALTRVRNANSAAESANVEASLHNHDRQADRD